MRSLSVVTAALLVLALFTGVSTGVPSGAHASTPAASPDLAVAQDSFEPADPGTVIEVNVTESGDAQWSVSYRYRLTGENETTAFRQYGRAVAKGQEQLTFSAELFQQFADQASTWTGRDMEIRDTSWQEPVVREPAQTGTTTTTTTGSDETVTRIGVLTYTFTWTNFAEVQEDGEVRVGDAFGTENETWLPTLYDGQRFVINEPQNFAIINSPADKGPQNSSLIWDGPQTFEPGYIEATYVPREPSQTPTTPGTTPGGLGEEGGLPLELIGFGLLVVLVAAGSYLFARWQTEREQSAPTATPNGGHDTVAADSSTTDGPRQPETTDTDAATDAATAASAGAAAADEATDDETEAEDDAADADQEEEELDPIDVELLSDEERVLRLLRQNNGRMKQANIVKETGWSNAKVSQLLSGMDDDDEIEKLRIGRENLITLPGESIGDFDDDA
ncbi:helix-turn-helix transcriptional regulator [Haloarchaeobius sp. TZWSO28]|uniref:helix-turn-helix transcriptional regulator n=1 Tax=Haloarchaeobius sp. TZWSO28 TaxID=3446119 RepID=UPI003EB77B30